MSPKLKRSLLGIYSLIAVSGCERPALPEQKISNDLNAGKSWHWAEASESSVLNYSKVYDIETMRRCWLRPRGYDCLYLLRNGDWYQAQRYQMPKLNRGSDDDPVLTGKHGGYRCSFITSGSLDEGIAGTGDFLTKNTVALNGQFPSRPWTAQHVEDFIRENSIDGPRTHFDCTELAGQVLSGSVETLGSTSIGYSQLMK